MPRRKSSAIPKPIKPVRSYEPEFALADDSHWFVYLFALTDCSGFKVGFSCNPLQRISTFSRRYFERFDLMQSMLCRVPDCDAARALESELKSTLAAYQAPAPLWVPLEAGGHTEWFSAVYFSDAEARARSRLRADSIRPAFEQFAADLLRAKSSFEAWAVHRAQQAADIRQFATRGYAVRDRSSGLRDWLGAYRYFDIPLFVDDPEVGRIIEQYALLAD